MNQINNKLVTEIIPMYPSLCFRNIEETMYYLGNYSNIQEFLTNFRSPKKEFILEY